MADDNSIESGQSVRPLLDQAIQTRKNKQLAQNQGAGVIKGLSVSKAMSSGIVPGSETTPEQVEHKLAQPKELAKERKTKKDDFNKGYADKGGVS